MINVSSNGLIHSKFRVPNALTVLHPTWAQNSLITRMPETRSTKVLSVDITSLYIASSLEH